MAQRVDTDILCRPIAFDYPDRLVGPAPWVGHIPFAFWIVDALRPKLFVELGTHTGNSYCAFTQAVQRLQLDTQCFAIDTWRGDPHAGFYGDEVFEELSRYHDSRYARFSRLVRSTFDEARDYFEPGSIDLLHIDGLHTYEAVKHDFENWIGRMSAHGVVLMHDINVLENEFGVCKLWNELAAQYPHFQFVHSNGLGVLGVGRDIDRPLRWLFENGDAGQAGTQARAFFERLGAGLIDRLARAENEERIRHAEMVERESVERANHLKRLVQELEAITADRDKVVTWAKALQQENSARGTHIKKLEGLLETLQRDAGPLRAAAADLEATRAELARLRPKLQQANAWKATSITLSEEQRLTDRLIGDLRDRHPRPILEVVRGMIRGDRSWGMHLDGRRRWIRALFALRHPFSSHKRRSRYQDGRSLGSVFGDLLQVFEEGWYLRRYPDVRAQGRSGLAHYLDQGWREERDPSPLFDARYYHESNPDVAVARVDPLVHYLQFGGMEGRRFHPLFDVDFYRHQAAAADLPFHGNPLVHYLTVGAAAGLSPHPLFDSAGYAKAVPELRIRGVDPLRFYLTVGHRGGPNPHPLFDTDWYLRQSPDIAASGMNALEHYLRIGSAEERNPHPLFNTRWYLAQNPDVASSGMNPLVHYVRIGAANGHDPHPLFDTSWYLERNSTAANSGLSPLAHYVQHGMNEECDPNPLFDRARYLQRYPDVAATGMNPFLHYVLQGADEGREPSAHARDRPAARPAPAPEASPVDVEPDRASSGTIDELRNQIVVLKQALTYHAHRIDHALGVGEGVLDFADDLQRARKTFQFQEPFERSNPLVTVCVATYNRAPILVERCIRSLRAQSYSNLQIVVVGDHCTDDTGYRLAQLRDDRIVFDNLPQRGPYPRAGVARWQVAGSNAMNRALDLAEGDFIAHLDDDDEAAFDRIAVMVERARSLRAEFCWHPFWYEGPDGTWTHLGNGEFTLGQMTTGSTFYHRYYARIKWDVQAFRLDEPGDWNRLRKIKLLRPTMAFVDRPLMFHYTEMNQGPFVPQPGEIFLN